MPLSDKNFEKLKQVIKEAGFDLEKKQSFQEFLTITEKLGKIKKRYQNGTLGNLASFEDSNHLEKYISSAYRINEYSNDDAISHFKINHILFKIIKQNYISLYTLLSYQFSSLTIDDLEDAYTLSGTIQERLIKTLKKGNGRNERLAWFINLKNPLVYWDTDDVKRHYSMIIKNLSEKENIDNRRMHIFYEDYLDNNNLNVKQIKKIFQGLFFEKLIGIDNKLIIINNFNKIKDKLYFDPYGLIKNTPDNFNSEQFKCLFLLDYALYQFPNITQSESCQDYDYYLLPANFSLEPPITEEKNVIDLKKKYEDESVFEFTGPYIYYIFKRNFQSFWHKKNYIESLDELIIHKAWRITKTYKSQILPLLFSNNIFIGNIKSMIDGLASKINLFIEDFSFELDNKYEIFTKKNSANLSTFVKNNLNHSELISIEDAIENSNYFNDKNIDLNYKEQLSSAIFNFNQGINFILRKLVAENKTSIASIKDFMNITFNSDKYFHPETQEFYLEEKSLLQLVFSYFDGDVNELIFKNKIGDDFNELEKEILEIRNIFDKNIHVTDFFSFWEMIIHDDKIPIKNANDIFDEIFLDSNNEQESLYIKKIEDQNDSDYKDIEKLRQRFISLCNEFYTKRITKTKNKKLLQNKFESKFNEFLVKKIY